MQIKLNVDTIDEIFIERLKEDITTCKRIKEYGNDVDIEFYEAFKTILKYYGCDEFLKTL
jgi:hypothetical protein